jgi:hypothetical protein
VNFGKHIAIIGPPKNVKLSVDQGRFDELRTQSQRCMIQFLETELQLGFTFVDSAAYQRALGQAQHSQRTIEEARKAVTAIHRFLGRIDSIEIRDAIADRCSQLDRAVAALEVASPSVADP